MASIAEKYGPWCIVAGASEGIGFAFAKEIVRQGVNVLLVSRSQVKLDEAAAVLRDNNRGVEIETLAVDLSEMNACGIVKAAMAQKEVGLLVYNVGAEPQYGDFMDHGWEILQQRLQRNFVTKARFIHEFGNMMKARGRGGMILMGSVAAFNGSPGFALYSASKAFTHTLSEALWHELKKDGVDVLCPVIGPIDTPQMIEAYGASGHDTDPDWVAQTAIEQISNGPLWLAEGFVKERAAEMAGLQPAARAERAARNAKAYVSRNKH